MLALLDSDKRIYFNNCLKNICFGVSPKGVSFMYQKCIFDKKNTSYNHFRDYIFLCLPPYNSNFQSSNFKFTRFECNRLTMSNYFTESYHDS